MTENDLRQRLLAVDPDISREAERRAWQAVRRVCHPGPARRRRVRRRAAVPALACVVLLTGGVLAAAGRPRGSLTRWLRAAIGEAAPPRARPTLGGLPGGGRLLVNAAGGPWIVGAAGRRTYLGAYTAAAWSPHALYLIAWRGTDLAALAPRGAVQWTVAADGPVSVARWSPDGYRIAYLAGHALWVIAGDGTGDHRLRAVVAPVAPAWQPRTGLRHRIAFVDARGAVELADADTGARLWRIRVSGWPRQLIWSPGGTRLVVVSRNRLSLYDADGRLLAAGPVARGEHVTGAAFAHVGLRLAVAFTREGQGSLGVLAATRAGLSHPPQVVFSIRQPLSSVSWSPGDRWLLTASPPADEWIFAPATPPAKLLAVGRISAQFRARPTGPDRFPGLGGWQVGAGRPGGG
ncbi:MAG TPA: hypothetical protein VG325_13745 [Solirubrobacteraceae bacterium]|nr:hypothetical protein [Solirubrobacteraceae bacterium]